MRFLFFSTFFYLLNSLAAPYPGTSSSALMKNHSYFKSEFGFSIGVHNLDWQRRISTEPGLISFYEKWDAQKKQSARFSIRIEKIEEQKYKYHKSLKSYMSYWKQNFAKFGLRIVDAKLHNSFQESALAAKEFLFVESTQSEAGFRSAQWVFTQEKNFIHFHCIDKNENFDTTLKDCQKMIDSLSWQ